MTTLDLITADILDRIKVQSQGLSNGQYRRLMHDLIRFANARIDEARGWECVIEMAAADTK